MDRYMVISPHTYEECQAIVNQVVAAGFSTRVDFGCVDNDHTGWIVVEADSKEEALMIIPALMRPKARAVKVVHFSPTDVDPVHL